MNNLIREFSRKDRRALAKLITLVESQNDQSRLLMKEILPTLPKPSKASIRIAISGPPGVGKSTFINRMGQTLVAQGFRIAVLPIDPASERSFGSILADKTRMSDIINEPNVFIRPSSSRGALGGINASMSDVIFLVESFGYDFIIIETIGVGQAETLAYSLADFFVVLMQPGSGDGLQAMKKGILEKADFVLINKNDHEFLKQAQQAYNALQQALSKNTCLALVSALNNTGIDDFISKIISAFNNKLDTGSLRTTRQERLVGFINFALQERLMHKLLNRSVIQNLKNKISKRVVDHEEALGPMIDELSEDILSELKNF